MKLIHLPTLTLLVLPRLVQGWGAVGHEIVATIAQIHLHNESKVAIEKLLPGLGHLGPIASWPDRIRGLPQYRWSGELHYTSPLEDYPPGACHFGDKGWKTDHDLLHAISNYTQRLVDDPLDGVALRFLVHFLGDVHQPLHLTDRDRGGNQDGVIFEGRRMNLHSLWDTGLITKAVREQKNYTAALPATQIESSLRHTIYDPYIRLILWEGVRTWWRSSLPSWFDCAPAVPPPQASSTLFKKDQIILSSSPATSTKLDEPISRQPSSFGGEGPLGICPVIWASETHKVTCSNTFPDWYHTGSPARELNTKEYYGPIKDGNLIEKLLAQGGLRLAAVLNSIFATPELIERRGPINLSWLE